MNGTVQALSSQIRGLPREEAWELHEWLAEYLEDGAELAPDFAASIQRGKEDIALGRTRKREPESE